MADPFVHVELSTTDVDKAKAFYGRLLDWTLENTTAAGGMSYTLNAYIEAARVRGSEPTAGFEPSDPDGATL